MNECLFANTLTSSREKRYECMIDMLQFKLLQERIAQKRRDVTGKKWKESYRQF